jgi:hypothetical protein
MATEPDEPGGSADPGSGIWLLVVAGIAVGLSFVMLFFDGIRVHIAGYVLASLLAFTCVAFFRRRALERLVTAGIATPPEWNVLAWCVLVGGLGCCIVHAGFVATLA